MHPITLTIQNTSLHSKHRPSNFLWEKKSKGIVKCESQKMLVEELRGIITLWNKSAFKSMDGRT